MLKKLYDHTVVRYIVVGGGSFVIELCLLLFLHEAVGLQRTVATAISFWFAIIISFLLQKLLAFKDYRKEINRLSKQGLFYGLLIVFNYIFTLIVVSIFSEEYLIFSRILAITLVTFWNYFVYKKVIFKTRKD